MQYIPVYGVSAETDEYSRLEPAYEGALERIVVDDQLDGVGSAVLEFDSGAKQIRDSGTFALESQVSVHLGYKDDCAQVFAGEVTEFRADFSADGHERIKVVCRNCLYKLQNAYQSRAFEEKRVSDALKERLESYGLKGNIEPFGAVKHYFVENGVTDYEYLMQNAKKYGKTVYAYEDTVYIQDEVTISEAEVILEWGKSVISFRCSENLKGQLSGCVFAGWDELKCEGITERAELADIAVKAGGEHTWKDNGKGAGGVWESVFSADDVYDSEDAKQRAAGYLQNRSMEYQTGAVKCEGNRHIFPGMRITVKNVGDYFSGEYIAERVVHELSVSRGFMTEVYVKRNMTAGGASHVPGAELAEQEGSGNTETEQAAGGEGNERIPLYENEADDTAADTEQQTEEETETENKGTDDQVNNSIPQLNGSANQFACGMKSLVGSQYVWGGDTPDDGGMDCSGSIIYMLNQQGNKIPDQKASDLYYNYTMEVDGHIQPGDLRFLRDSLGRIVHIQTIIDVDGTRVNATEGPENTRENPGTIDLLPGPLPGGGEIRRFNFSEE